MSKYDRLFSKMGVEIHQDGEYVEIEGKGIEGLEEPHEVLDVGNSGTTIRLLLRYFSECAFHTIVIGDESIGTTTNGPGDKCL